jgi:hypothetical protein
MQYLPSTPEVLGVGAEDFGAAIHRAFASDHATVCQSGTTRHIAERLAAVDGAGFPALMAALHALDPDPARLCLVGCFGQWLITAYTEQHHARHTATSTRDSAECRCATPHGGTGPLRSPATATCPTCQRCRPTHPSRCPFESDHEPAPEPVRWRDFDPAAAHVMPGISAAVTSITVFTAAAAGGLGEAFVVRVGGAAPAEFRPVADLAAQKAAHEWGWHSARLIDHVMRSDDRLGTYVYARDHPLRVLPAPDVATLAPSDLSSLRGCMEDGYTSDEVNDVFATIEHLTGHTLVCVWAYVDAAGTGGDSQFYLSNASGSLFEASSTIWLWLNGDPRSPTTPAEPGDPSTWCAEQPENFATHQLAYHDGNHNYATRDLILSRADDAGARSRPALPLVPTGADVVTLPAAERDPRP